MACLAMLAGLAGGLSACAECDTPLDCDEGERCNNGSCESFRTGVECTQDSECVAMGFPAGTARCQAGTCRSGMLGGVVRPPAPDMTVPVDMGDTDMDDDVTVMPVTPDWTLGDADVAVIGPNAVGVDSEAGVVVGFDLLCQPNSTVEIGGVPGRDPKIYFDELYYASAESLLRFVPDDLSLATRNMTTRYRSDPLDVRTNDVQVAACPGSEDLRDYFVSNSTTAPGSLSFLYFCFAGPGNDGNRWYRDGRPLAEGPCALDSGPNALPEAVNEGYTFCGTYIVDPEGNEIVLSETVDAQYARARPIGTQGFWVLQEGDMGNGVPGTRYRVTFEGIVARELEYQDLTTDKAFVTAGSARPAMDDEGTLYRVIRPVGESGAPPEVARFAADNGFFTVLVTRSELDCPITSFEVLASGSEE
jgi:hypothetical protein